MDSAVTLEKLNGRPIVLIGMMGCGKSSIAALLGDVLGVDVHDTDEMVVQRAGQPIVEIFLDQGEIAFREMEVHAVKDAIAQGGVISVGGGAVENPETLSLIKERCVCIWLDSDFDVLIARLEGDDTRPLLKGSGLEEKIHHLFEERHHLYEQADKHVKNNGTPEEAVKMILEEIMRD